MSVLTLHRPGENPTQNQMDEFYMGEKPNENWQYSI